MWNIALNWIGIIVAAIVAYVFGMIWYSPMLFGKDWMKTMPKGKKMQMTAGSMLSIIIAVLLMALLLDFFISATGSSLNMSMALLVAGAIWLGFFLTKDLVAMAMGGSLKMFTINAMHDLIAVALIAAILVLV